MTKTAIITGATGQDGAHFAVFFLKKRHEVHGVKRRAPLFNAACADLTSFIPITQLVQEREIHEPAAMGHVALRFFANDNPDCKFLAAPKVCGIVTDNTYPVYSKAMAEAGELLMKLPHEKQGNIRRIYEGKTSTSESPLVKIGVGEHVTRRLLAEMVKPVVDYHSEIFVDTTEPDGAPRETTDVEELRSIGWSPITEVTSEIHIASTEVVGSDDRRT